MSSIKLTKKLQGYIVESMPNNERIPPATNIFCGSCGGSIGVTTIELTLPFRWEDLERSMRDHNIMVFSQQGVQCQHCKHVVSLHAGDMKFTALSLYREWFPETDQDEQ